MTTNTRGLTIGELAHRSGIGVETIRFYERCALVDQPERPGGFRRYPVETVTRLRFIQRAKALGFTLRDTQELLVLCYAPQGNSAELSARAQGKAANLETRIRDLVQIRDEFAGLSDADHGQR